MTAILAQAEGKAREVNADPANLSLAHLLQAYDTVLRRKGIIPDEDTRYYRFLLKLSLEPYPNWWDKLQVRSWHLSQPLIYTSVCPRVTSCNALRSCVYRRSSCSAWGGHLNYRVHLFSVEASMFLKVYNRQQPTAIDLLVRILLVQRSATPACLSIIQWIQQPTRPRLATRKCKCSFHAMSKQTAWNQCYHTKTR